jgi:hypothetical protein
MFITEIRKNIKKTKIQKTRAVSQVTNAPEKVS